MRSYKKEKMMKEMTEGIISSLAGSQWAEWRCCLLHACTVDDTSQKLSCTINPFEACD